MIRIPSAPSASRDAWVGHGRRETKHALRTVRRRLKIE